MVNGQCLIAVVALPFFWANGIAFCETLALNDYATHKKNFIQGLPALERKQTQFSKDLTESCAQWEQKALQTMSPEEAGKWKAIVSDSRKTIREHALTLQELSLSWERFAYEESESYRRKSKPRLATLQASLTDAKAKATRISYGMEACEYLAIKAENDRQLQEAEKKDKEQAEAAGMIGKLKEKLKPYLEYVPTETLRKPLTQPPLEAENARIMMTQRKMEHLKNAVETRKLLFESYPSNLEDVVLVTYKGFLADAMDPLKDSWGNVVRYERTENAFTITSSGKDGTFSSQDDIIITSQP